MTQKERARLEQQYLIARAQYDALEKAAEEMDRRAMRAMDKWLKLGERLDGTGKRPQPRLQPFYDAEPRRTSDGEEVQAEAR